jgi:hypothetical protein
MYSGVRKGVNVLIFLGFAFWLGAAHSGAAPQAAAPGSARESCTPALLTLYAPSHPQLGRYEVCTTPAPLDAVADPGWAREPTAPLDALGAAGGYDRAAVARLYGATRPVVARGWIRRDGQLESVTLISPYPDASAAHLEAGTLIIRLIICCL